MSVDYEQDAYDLACEQEKAAAEQYALAEQAYNESIEALQRAKSNLSEGKRLLNRFLAKEDKYRADFSPLLPPGEEALMRYVANYDVKEAISHLQKILDVVEAYCNSPMALNQIHGSYFYDQQDNYDKPSKKGKTFRREKAMEDTAEQMRKDRPRKMPNPDTISRCKVCGRPFAICRCKPSELPDVNPK
jgi:hypothetical protein